VPSQLSNTRKDDIEDFINKIVSSTDGTPTSIPGTPRSSLPGLPGQSGRASRQSDIGSYDKASMGGTTVGNSGTDHVVER
jgi:hypothetical protein